MRRVQAPLLLERFFVSAVVSVLLIRAWLALTGYPQIGGHGLHIAHVLFGGIGMLIALLVGLTLLGESTRQFAATVGGAGFGAFIDELGKFITSDNDYFYRPAIALIYVVFVLVFIGGQRLAIDAQPKPDERLAQALDVLSGAAVRGFPKGERNQAMRLLMESNPENPLVPALTDALARIATTPDPEVSLAEREAMRVARSYTWLVGQRWFLTLVIALAVLATVFGLGTLSIVVLTDPVDARVHAYLDSTAGLLALASLVGTILMIVGLLHLRGSRLSAYRWLRRSVLVFLLAAQPLAFYEQQLMALVGLALNLMLLSALELGLARESAASEGSATSSV
jgi:hypothetical protein